MILFIAFWLGGWCSALLIVLPLNRSESWRWMLFFCAVALVAWPIISYRVDKASNNMMSRPEGG